MNSLRVAIHQPNFIPWLGYFHKMSMVDVFVLLDDVQVPVGKSFATRALIKTNTGELWITVPTLNRSDKEDFRSTQILQSNWRTKTIKTIRLAYQKAPYFNNYFDAFEKIYLTPYEYLYDLNYALLVFVRDALGLKTKFVSSKELTTDTTLIGEEKILSLLEATHATLYVSGKGAGSRRYIDEQHFKERNIELVWQEFQQPSYQQLHGPTIENLSAVDYLFNCGPNGSAFNASR